MHGGASTGPRTPEGRERSKRARWKHGSYSVEAERAFQNLKAECQAFNAALAARRATMTTGTWSASRILEEISRVAFADARSLFDAQGKLKPLAELTDDERAAIATIRVVRRRRRPKAAED